MEVNDLTKVFWYGWNDTFFQLSGDGDHTRVVLKSVSGLTSEISRTLRGRSNGIGGNIQGTIVEVMPGNLDVELIPTSNQSLPEIWEEWKGSWSTSGKNQGQLEVITRTGAWSVPAILQKNIATPTPGPSTLGLSSISSSVEVLALDGIWSGEPQDLSDTTGFEVTNIGTVDIHPEVHWVGTGQTVTFPDGRTINLPSVATTHRITLDPGRGFKVWDSDGAHAVGVWASFRGLDLRAPIAPGESRGFKCTSGAFVRVTPLHENPWG